MLRRSLWLYAQLALVVLFSQFVIVAAEEAVQPKKLNPFTGNPEAITEGRALYLRVGCSGCHGGGGGGMGPALLDDEWTFGSDDEILFGESFDRLPIFVLYQDSLNHELRIDFDRERLLLL